jgi:uncharacterized alpha-E superfamily protein
MLSRVANSIFWANRYIERAENYARFLDVNFNLSLDLPPDIPEQWKPMVVTTGDWELFQKKGIEPTRDNVVYFLGFDKENPNSILNCIQNGRENARTFRESITKEIWEQINFLYFLVNKGHESKIWLKKRASRKFFADIRNGCQLLYGIEDATISRTEGWHFGRIGRYLERADKTSRLLDVKYHYILPSVNSIGSTLDMLHWTALLKSVSAYTMYRRTYGKLMPLQIAQFLLLDRNFPRAILHCLTEAERSVLTVSSYQNGQSNSAMKKLGMLRSEIEFADISEVFSKGLHEYLDDCQLKMNQVSNEVFNNFFAKKVPQQFKTSENGVYKGQSQFQTLKL